MASLLMLMAVSVLLVVGGAVAAGAGVALWKARRTGGGAFCLWRVFLVYDCQGYEPFPGKGYELNLGDGVGETIHVFNTMEGASMPHAEIEKRLTYHRPHGDQPLRFETIRAKAKELAYVLVDCCPGSPDLTKALNQLDLVVFLANASIARNEISDGKENPKMAMGYQHPVCGGGGMSDAGQVPPAPVG